MKIRANFSSLNQQISKCFLCNEYLPFSPRPIYQLHPASKILIIGQAPSLKVQETGIAWNDMSGKRLVEWLGITSEMLHNKKIISILPMGFCYPGKNKTGDLPPRKECAPLWHPKLLPLLNVRLTLLIGQYAQSYYLKERQKKSLTETVRAWKEYQPLFVPLPHPSPLNNRWLSKNKWFLEENVPQIKKLIRSILDN